MSGSRLWCAAIGLGIVALAAPVAPARSQPPATPPSTAPSRPLDDLMRIAVRYDYDNVSDIDDWHQAALFLSRRFPFGTFVAGVNTARRYRKNGLQLELQAYPHLSARSYVALEGAWSGSEGVFVPLRLSAEPYYNFANGWETSVGIGYFQSAGPDVYVYTGTLAKYSGNYWLSGRPHFSRGAGDGSYGLEVTARRYFSHRYDYLSVIVGRSIGISADVVDPQRLGQRRGSGGFVVRVERRQPLGLSRLRATYGAGYERERIAAGSARIHRTAAVGLEWFVP